MKYIELPVHMQECSICREQMMAADHKYYLTPAGERVDSRQVNKGDSMFRNIAASVLTTLDAWKDAVVDWGLERLDDEVAPFVAVIIVAFLIGALLGVEVGR